MSVRKEILDLGVPRCKNVGKKGPLPHFCPTVVRIILEKVMTRKYGLKILNMHSFLLILRLLSLWRTRKRGVLEVIISVTMPSNIGIVRSKRSTQVKRYPQSVFVG